MLFKKLLRTLGRYKAQFISMIIMIALGVGIFAGFSGEWYTIKKDSKYFYDLTGFSDYRIMNSEGFTQADLDKVLEVEGIEKATLYLSVDSSANDGDKVTLNTTTNMEVSGFTVNKGNAYDENNIDGIWLSDMYAKANKINLDDTFTLKYKGIELNLKVEGLIKSSEYLICVTDKTQLMPDFKNMGYGYVTSKTIEKALGMPFYSQINVISNLDKETFEKDVFSALENSYLLVTKNEAISYSEVKGEINEGKTMASLIPVLFLAIAMLTMITTMHRLTVNEKMQIGILKALGFKDRKIIVHYSSYALFIGILGSVFGIALGYGLCWYIMNPHGPMGTYFDLPKWNLYMPWYVWVAIIIMNLVLTFVGYASVKKILKGSAADALRPYTPKKMKPLLIEKTKWFHKRRFAFRWNIRDVFRHKARSLMSIIGVVGCTLLLVATFGVKYLLHSFVSDYYEKPMNYEVRINLSDETSNEKALEIATTYSGDLTSTTPILIDENVYSIEVYNVENGLISILDMNTKPIKNVSNEGAYVPNKLANELKIKVGDEIEIKSFATGTVYSVKVVQITRSLTGNIVITDDYADTIGLAHKYNCIYTKEKDVAVNEYIESVQTKKDIINSFSSIMEVLDVMVVLLALASVILGIVVLYNLGILSYMERYRELATLKVLGFKDKKITSLLVTQNMWMTLFGMIIGAPLGVWILKVLMDLLASDYDIKLRCDPRMFIYSFILVGLTSLFVSYMVARKNKYINMVEALKAE
ncbi:MAG: ABC transporter permease [bacterium]|nr:ABC transporter permease [bacterium]